MQLLRRRALARSPPPVRWVSDAPRIIISGFLFGLVFVVLFGLARRPATVVTSNRTPDEWLGLMHDQLLAQSAVDRLTSTCHELVIEGDSYRKRQRPSLGSGA